ncbi:uncharacterized protein MELLADRAFT_67046 [Melampsora larici-populina 98AG31]|uniref:Uncharacterized protein n=1 Tax=Melampsora larici-populina (strain 98AG31 / pathotype 3-4-7) TaxID=747676 RepID=F4S1K9_MELLP|nr:uncharacterized protein MELLADRAFT_67046 [Melampsora larici-populina 98AG31]EGG01394.1 hypothetical protein MELLADRAFT_67046 [Melampsora larici-populina 98AG31]
MNSANENQLEVQQSNRNCSHRSIDLSEFEPKPIHQSTTTNTADDRPIASANATQPQLIIHSSPRTPFTPIKKHSYHSFTPNNTPIKSNNTPIKSYTPVKANNTPIKAYNTPVKSYTPIRQSINPNTPIRQSINPSTPIKSTHTPIRQSINPQLILLQSDSIKPKARLTPEAIPRKKPILPGAPNPIHVNSSHSQPIFSPSYQPSSSSNTRPSLIHYDDEGETDEDDLNPSSGHQNVLVAIRLRYIDQPSRSVWSFSEADAQIWETNSSGPNHDSTFGKSLKPNSISFSKD